MDDNSGLSPVTELDAVNAMLFVIGESPVDTIDQDTVEEAGKALRLLRAESRLLQTRGWSFNTDEGVHLLPDSSGEIPLPPALLGITFKGADTGGPLCHRAGRVYDRRRQTFAIRRAVRADLVQLLSFEDIPEVARQYVAIRATRRFQDGELGDSAIHQFCEQDEQWAWAEFLQRETEDCHYNVNRDSASVRRVTIARYRYIT